VGYIVVVTMGDGLGRYMGGGGVRHGDPSGSSKRKEGRTGVYQNCG